jgi:futalosine hydrolase
VPSPLALLCSVDLECAELRAALADPAGLRLGRRAAWSGTLEGRAVILLPGGMGKTNTAQTLTALLESTAVSGVIGFGVAGAYPGSGLAVGDLALGTEEIYGDEGVEAPEGWISSEGIGIPLLDRASGPLYNRFPADAQRIRGASEALRAAGKAVCAGPFVTVSACSGTARRGEELAGRFTPLCESMEGAALAHVATLYEVPWIEVRAVSNAVEDRDLSRWRLRDAAAAAQDAVRILVAAAEGIFPSDAGNHAGH